jgi:O-antigen ligase
MNLKYSNSVLINLIIVSIIPFLIWGPFFPDLIVSISALFFLFYVFKNKEFYFFNNKPLIIFFSFCIYCILLSVFVAKDICLVLKAHYFILE